MKAVFFDRDGVINVEKNYLHLESDFSFVSGAVEALKLFKGSGYAIFIITNQAGIGRGYFSEDDYFGLTQYYLSLLKEEGVEVEKVYFCPHHPVFGLERYKVDCECRKPNPGMINQAVLEFGVDLSNSLLFGDKVSDIAAGRNAGVGKCFLVRSGHPLSHEDELIADGIFDNIFEYAKKELIV